MTDANVSEILLRERLLDVLHEDVGVGPAAAHAAVTAILDMPEMQAIRNLLLWYRDEMDTYEDHAWWATLPPSVQEWAVGVVAEPCTSPAAEEG